MLAALEAGAFPSAILVAADPNWFYSTLAQSTAAQRAPARAVAAYGGL